MAQHLRRALRQALTGRPGPVHLNVPVDLWERPLEEVWFDPKTYRPDTRTFDRTAVQRAAQHLVNAKRPVFFAGAGVGGAGAEEHLRSLAELLPARVATTPRGKGLFPEDHALSLGVMGFAGHAGAREVLLGPGDGRAAHHRHVAQRDGHAQLDARAPQEPRVHAARHRLRSHRSELPRRSRARRRRADRARRARLSRASAHTRRCAPASTWGDEPRRAAHRSRIPRCGPRIRCRSRRSAGARISKRSCPKDAIVFSDIGGHMLSNIHYLTIGEGRSSS